MSTDGRSPGTPVSPEGSEVLEDLEVTDYSGKKQISRIENSCLRNENFGLSENSRGNNRNKHIASKVDWPAKHAVPVSGDQAWRSFLLDGQSDPFAYAVIGGCWFWI